MSGFPIFAHVISHPRTRRGEGNPLGGAVAAGRGDPSVRMLIDSEVFGESVLLLTGINGRCLRLVGMGDNWPIDAIAISLRLFP